MHPCMHVQALATIGAYVAAFLEEDWGCGGQEVEEEEDGAHRGRAGARRGIGGGEEEEEEEEAVHADPLSRPVVFTGGDAPLLFAALQQSLLPPPPPPPPSSAAAAVVAAAAAAAGRLPRAHYLLRDDLAFRGLHSLARARGWLPPGVPLTLPPPVAAAVAAQGGAAGPGEGAGPTTHLDGAPCEHVG